MSACEDRLFLLALASGSISFVLFVVDLGETPLVFENIRPEALFAMPLILWLGWCWLRRKLMMRHEDGGRLK
ncbi:MULTISPECIES: hypothetical protein [Sphingomonas]|uniref:hypothetical protein n=1 Tax=Sphingomonas TaxID=13687 RepID=UPI000DEF5529|nr:MULTISPECIES: hypothetical protein [Sphingomonas]